MGKDKPRSLPLLATPTPHVRVVRYPEQSLPFSRHWEQYGRRLSQLDPLLMHAKQSSEAPVVGTRRRRFLSVAGPVGIPLELIVSTLVAAITCLSSVAKMHPVQGWVQGPPSRTETGPVWLVCSRWSLLSRAVPELLEVFPGWSAENASRDPEQGTSSGV